MAQLYRTENGGAFHDEMDRRRRPDAYPDVGRLSRDGSCRGGAIAGRAAKSASVEGNRSQRAASLSASQPLRLSPVLPALLLRPADLLCAGAVLSLPRVETLCQDTSAPACRDPTRLPRWSGFHRKSRPLNSLNTSKDHA